MSWIIEKLGGRITHADQIDYSKYPADCEFAAV
jgi:hypothetical protein